MSSVALAATVTVCSEMALAQVYPNPGEGGGRQFQMGLGMLEKAKEAFQMGDYMAAIEICKRAKTFAPGEKKIVHLLALAYAEAGDNYNANLEFIQCTNLDYNFIEARNNYGRFLMKTGKKKEAGLEFEKCITINPNYPDAHYNLGVLRMDQGDRSSPSSKRSWATIMLAMLSSMGVPRKTILSLNNREKISKARSPREVVSITVGG